MNQPERLDLKVNYDVRSRQPLVTDQTRRIFVGNTSVSDFPSRLRGVATVKFAILVLDRETTYKEIMEGDADRHSRPPHRAESETYFDHLRDHEDYRLHMAICNMVRTSSGLLMSGISQYNGGRFYYRWKPEQAIVQSARIIVVLS